MPLRILKYISVENEIPKGIYSEISDLIFLSNDERIVKIGLGFLRTLNEMEANQEIHYSFKPVSKFLYFHTTLTPNACMLYRQHGAYRFYASKVPASMSLDALEVRALLACGKADEHTKVAIACQRHNQLGL